MKTNQSNIHNTHFCNYYLLLSLTSNSAVLMHGLWYQLRAHTHAHTYTHTYIQTHTYTHIHTHTYTHTQSTTLHATLLVSRWPTLPAKFVQLVTNRSFYFSNCHLMPKIHSLNTLTDIWSNLRRPAEMEVMFGSLNFIYIPGTTDWKQHVFHYKEQTFNLV